jgi:predicted unusual protein kinase regulating ubiquinone biosynthesis (AarF/ABC1/UbiB family)
MGTKELNVPATTKAQKRGIVVYNKDMMVSSNGRPMKLRFHVPEVYDLGPNSQMMIQEFVPGMSFDAFEKKAPDLALRSIEALSKHWLDEALLGSGFFQADTHRGNLLVTATNDMIQINILDFGMSGQLTKRMQRQIIGAALIVKSGRSDLLAKALWEISIDKENTISLSQLTTLIRNKMAEIESAGEPELGVGDWIGDVTAAGMKFPDEFVSLKRGLTLIDKMLEKSKSKLSGADIITSSLLRNPRLLREATGSLNSITRGEWAKLAWDGVTGKNNQDSSNRPLPRTCGAIFTATP